MYISVQTLFENYLLNTACVACSDIRLKFDGKTMTTIKSYKSSVFISTSVFLTKEIK